MVTFSCSSAQKQIQGFKAGNLFFELFLTRLNTAWNQIMFETHRDDKKNTTFHRIRQVTRNLLIALDLFSELWLCNKAMKHASREEAIWMLELIAAFGYNVPTKLTKLVLWTASWLAVDKCHIFQFSIIIAIIHNLSYLFMLKMLIKKNWQNNSTNYPLWTGFSI